MDIAYYKQFEPFWGVWTIDEELGAGSFGKVFRIKRDDFGEIYYSALKVISIPNDRSEVGSLKSEGMDDKSISDYYQSFATELVKEFSLMAKLKGHSNIVSYEDHMTLKHDDGLGYDIFIRMELLTPLNDYIINEQITEQTVLKVGVDICKALEVCSMQKIIHRDIKPENVFVSNLGTYKLGDFGVSRIAENATQGMSVKGTVNYMAPEVYKGQPYNATVDIYSLGIMLYKLSNNNRGPFLPPAPQPIKYEDRERAENLRMNGVPLPDAVNASPKLMRILRKATSYDSANRYQSPTSMLMELEQLLGYYGRGGVVEPANVPGAKETVAPPPTPVFVNNVSEDDATLGPGSFTGKETATDEGDATVSNWSNSRPEYASNKTDNNSVKPEFKPEKKKFKPEKIKQKPEKPESKPEKTEYKPEPIEYRPITSEYVVPRRPSMPKIIGIGLGGLLILGAIIGLIVMLVNNISKKNASEKISDTNNALYTIEDGIIVANSDCWEMSSSDAIQYFEDNEIRYKEAKNNVSNDVDTVINVLIDSKHSLSIEFGGTSGKYVTAIRYYDNTEDAEDELMEKFESVHEGDKLSGSEAIAKDSTRGINIRYKIGTNNNGVYQFVTKQ